MSNRNLARFSKPIRRLTSVAGTQNIGSMVKRVIRWYLAPSGLLLAAALALLLLAFSGIGPSRIFGVLAVGALAIFFPYRFSRQQGTAHEEASAVANRLNALRNDVTEQVAVVEKRANRRANRLGLRLRLTEEESNEVRDRLISAENNAQEHAELDRLGQRIDLLDGLERRVALIEELAGRLSQLEAISRRDSPQAAMTEQLRVITNQTTELERVVAAQADSANQLEERVIGLAYANETVIAARSDELTSRVNELETFIQRVADSRKDEGALLRTMETELVAITTREGRSGSLNAADFQEFSRTLSEDEFRELAEWGKKLGVGVERRHLAYLASEIRSTEDRLLGRLAGSIGSGVLRSLVHRSVNARKVSVLEIGTLFGISIAALDATSTGFFEECHYTSIDPFDGYYNTKGTDLLTGMPVHRSVFDENMRRAGIGDDRLTVVQHLSTDHEALAAVNTKSVDVLFIDGDHSRFGVEADFRHYVHTVAPGGFVIFDDYGSKEWTEVAEFVDDVVKKSDELVFVGSGWETAVFRVL